MTVTSNIFFIIMCQVVCFNFWRRLGRSIGKPIKTWSRSLRFIILFISLVFPLTIVFALYLLIDDLIEKYSKEP